jgi:hypothetical protein
MLSYGLKVAAVAAFVTGLAASTSAQTPAGGSTTPGGNASASSRQPAADANTSTTTAPTWETTFGYQVLHVPDRTFPFGLNVDGARNFGPIGIVADLGWARDSQDGLTSNYWNFAAGPRWSGPRAGRVWPYAQVLAGGLYARATTTVAGSDITNSRTRFMLQPGVGVGVTAGDGWGVIGQVDYRRVFLHDDTDGSSGENELRVFVGVRVLLD